MFFKFINGKKFYCDEKGVVLQKDGVDQEVLATDTSAVDIESGVDEATKMLSEAMQKALKAGDAAAVAQIQKTTEAVEKMFDALAEKAATRSSKVELPVQKASFDVEAVTKSFESMQKSGGTAVFTLKSDADLAYLAKGTDRSDLTDVVIEPEKDAEITRPAVRTTFIENIANVVPINSDSAKYTEVTGSTGAPATTAELGTIPQVDRAFQSYSKPVQKIAAISKHSNELLKYGPELVAVLKDMLAVDLNLVTDAQLLSGNGTAPNLQGVLGVAPVLDVTAVGVQVVPNANLFDVLRIAMTKIAVAGKGKFVPNFIVLNPADSEELDLTKNSSGDYIMPSFYAANGQLIKGARVIENTGITAGTFLVGDFRYLNVRTNGGVEVEITNSDSTDFQNDIISIKMRRYLAAYVKTNDNGAFMTGSISAVKGFLAA
jgi:HK97 family phage major capsid protein